MRYKFYKNLKYRKSFGRGEVERLLIKSIYMNDTLDRNFRQLIYNSSRRIFYKHSYTKIPKICILTNRNKGVSFMFGLSSHVLRRLSNGGFFWGVRKYVW